MNPVLKISVDLVVLFLQVLLVIIIIIQSTKYLVLFYFIQHNYLPDNPAHPCLQQLRDEDGCV